MDIKRVAGATGADTGGANALRHAYTHARLQRRRRGVKWWWRSVDLHAALHRGRSQSRLRTVSHAHRHQALRQGVRIYMYRDGPGLVFLRGWVYNGAGLRLKC